MWVVLPFFNHNTLPPLFFQEISRLDIVGEVRVELMDMAHVVRVYDGYTGFFKAGLSRAADYVVTESDNAELKRHKINLQTAFRMVIKDSQIFSIMIQEELVARMSHYLNHLNELGDVMRATARYAVALGEAYEIAKKYFPWPDEDSATDPPAY